MSFDETDDRLHLEVSEEAVREVEIDDDRDDDCELPPPPPPPRPRD